jgi:hypothetical protein
VTRIRFTLLTALAASLLLAPLARPAVRVIGGNQIQVQSAPWAVFVRQTISTGSLQCSGSIVDALHVVTAAHCVYDQNGNPASITSLTIRAGISNYTTPASDDAEQDRGVSSVRVHPGYTWTSGTGEDDVAVLALSSPLDLTGSAVQPIALPVPGAPFPTDAAVGLAGFGRELATRPPNGSLVWFTGATGDPDSCGGFSNEIIPDADAVAVCASAPPEAICTGDSGAGLVTTAGGPTLIGIASAGRPGCDLGTNGVFTYVPAPEILRFIQGDDSPPVAPRRTSQTTIDLTWQGPLVVGNTLSCASTGWDGTPSFVYAFVDSQTGTVLQQSARADYQLSTKDIGATIFCRVLATNDGGTAALRTDDTTVIGGPPHVGITTTAPRAAVRGRTVTVRVVVHTGAGLRGKFGVCIIPPARIASRVCTSQVVDDGSYGGFPFTLGLRIKQTAPVGVASLAIDAVAGVSRATTTATLRVTG